MRGSQAVRQQQIRPIGGPREGRALANINRAASAHDTLALSAVEGLSGAAKSLTLIHGSSCIPPHSPCIGTIPARAFEKATRIKIDYVIASIGSPLTRIEMTPVYFNGPGLFDDKLADAGARQ
jgi:hypothetical protein